MNNLCACISVYNYMHNTYTVCIGMKFKDIWGTKSNFYLACIIIYEVTLFFFTYFIHQLPQPPVKPELLGRMLQWCSLLTLTAISQIQLIVKTI